ncbi:hypothetical protein X892_2977 [Burkholderia pseudomallei MSHR3960]|nr:hypothetical protein X892_2977 [Burkholderia pseudomallei MSHR3960]
MLKLLPERTSMPAHSSQSPIGRNVGALAKVSLQSVSAVCRRGTPLGACAAPAATGPSSQ